MNKYITSLSLIKATSKCLLLALLVLAPSTVFAQTLAVSPVPTGGFVRITVGFFGDSAIGAASCGIKSDGSTANNCTFHPGELSLDYAVFTASNTVDGYRFVGWGGDCSSSGSEPEVRFNLSSSDITCSANFEPIVRPPYTQVVAYSSTNAGLACALVRGGTVQCWGDNADGQLGNNSTTTSAVAVNVQGISNAVEVEVGTAFACALLTDKSIRCWGDNARGQLGIGSTTDSLVPVKVTGISTAIAIGLGTIVSYAVLEGGAIVRWGSNPGPQANLYSSTPTSFATVTSATDVAVGTFHTCILLSNGSAKCAGSNSFGRLGIGSDSGNFDTPQDVRNLSTAIAISADGDHTCAALRDGGVKCWGRNSNGRTGLNNLAGNTTTPRTLSNISNASDIVTLTQASCALQKDGRVQCWGSNINGRTGFGTDVGTQNTPALVPNISTAVAIGSAHLSRAVCVILVNGNSHCWGQGYEFTPGLAPPGQPLTLNASEPVNVYSNYYIALAAPYRLANATISSLPSGLNYSEDTGFIYGTPTDGGTHNITITPTTSTLVTFNLPTTTVSIVVTALPETLTISDSADLADSISAGLATNTVVGTISLAVQDADDNPIPVTYSLVGSNDDFDVSTNGTITTKRELTANTTPTVMVRATFPESARTLQPDLPSIMRTFAISVTEKIEALQLHLRLFLEGPLQ